MREKGSGTRNAIERCFAEQDITIRPRLELGSNEAIKQAILAGLGISALSRHTLTLNQPGQFAVLNVEGFPILRHWYVVYPAGGSCGGGKGVSGLSAGTGGCRACYGGQAEIGKVTPAACMPPKPGPQPPAVTPFTWL